MNTGYTNPFARKYPRLQSDFYVNKVVGDELRMVKVRDISASGMFMYKLIEPESKSDEIGLEMMLPNSEEVIWAAGSVVREEQRDGIKGFAVQFTRISEQHRQLISDYVESCRSAHIFQVLETAHA